MAYICKEATKAELGRAIKNGSHDGIYEAEERVSKSLSREAHVFTYRTPAELAPLSSTQTEGNSASRRAPDSFSTIIAKALSWCLTAPSRQQSQKCKPWVRNSLSQWCLQYLADLSFPENSRPTSRVKELSDLGLCGRRQVRGAGAVFQVEILPHGHNITAVRDKAVRIEIRHGVVEGIGLLQEEVILEKHIPDRMGIGTAAIHKHLHHGRRSQRCRELHRRVSDQLQEWLGT